MYCFLGQNSGALLQGTGKPLARGDKCFVGTRDGLASHPGEGGGGGRSKGGNGPLSLKADCALLEGTERRTKNVMVTNFYYFLSGS